MTNWEHGMSSQTTLGGITTKLRCAPTSVPGDVVRHDCMPRGFGTRRTSCILTTIPLMHHFRFRLLSSLGTPLHSTRLCGTLQTGQ